MRARLSRIRLRDVVLFAVVAGAVAVAALFAAREAGLGDRSAVAEGEPLTLTLTAQSAVCETERARWWGYSGLRTNEQGRRVREPVTIGWVADAVVPVRWQVSGGTAPYTLVIDRESRDVERDYRSPAGTAKVGCGDTTVGTFFQEEDPAEGEMRFYRTDPEIDSGWKTVRATVTDANGATAEATVDVYVIYVTGNHDDLLRGGKTYRVFGHLITIPDGVDMRIGDASTDGVRSFYIEGTDPFVVIWLNKRTYREVKREVPSEDGTGARGSSAYSASDLQQFQAAFNQFANSVGRLPEQRSEQ